MSGPMRRWRSPLAWLLIQPIRFYQRFITPYTPATCRHYPTCSSYAVMCLREHGAAKGLLLGTWRILRCNPWSSGGVDYPPTRGGWRALPSRPTYRDDAGRPPSGEPPVVTASRPSQDTVIPMTVTSRPDALATASPTTGRYTA